jgi:L-seryl-tRNA(Ser) seleniumtransferase
LRVGKLTLAAFEAMLRFYRESSRLAERLITLCQLTRPETDIRAAAERLLPALQHALTSLPVSVAIVALASQIGSGCSR